MLLTTLLLLLVTSFVTSDVAFTIPEADFIPEGIAYDGRTRTFFVGSTFKRKIVAVSQKGDVRDFVPEGRDGIYGVVGMRVDEKRRILWAISSNAGASMPARGLDKTCLGCSIVTSYNVESGKLLKKYALSNKPSVHFLNDLVIGPSGDVFITDTMSGDLYRIAPGNDSLERWIGLGEKTFPNGIDISSDGRTLFVATGAGMTRVTIADRTMTIVEGSATEKPPVIDGLYFYKNSLVAIQPFEEQRKIVRYHLDPAGSRITRTAIVEADHQLFKQPTTGVIIGSDFYFIANAQLQIFRAMYKDGAYDRAGLADVVVMKTRLNPWYLGRHRPDPDAAAVHPFGVAAAAQEKRELLCAGFEPEHTRARILARNE